MTGIGPQLLHFLNNFPFVAHQSFTGLESIKGEVGDRVATATVPAKNNE